MSAIGSLLGLLLLLFELVLIARAVLDWVVVLSQGPEPEWRRRAVRVTHAVTEPVLAPVRRLIPPIRAGGVGIDLAFIIVFVLVLILRTLVVGL